MSCHLMEAHQIHHCHQRLVVIVLAGSSALFHIVQLTWKLVLSLQTTFLFLQLHHLSYFPVTRSRVSEWLYPRGFILTYRPT